jgi:DNA-binding beta-propeller fold protein YncE
MTNTAPPAARNTRHALAAAAIVVAALSGTPAEPVSTFSARPLAAGQPGQGKGAKPKGTVWVVNRDLGELAVFDAATGDVLARQPVGRGAHDVCISEQARKAYITAETDNAVTVVDTDTLATESIPVGPLPHHIEPSNDGHTIYVSLASHPTTQPAPGKNEYAAIDTRDHSVTYRISSHNAGARSHAMAPDLDGERLYVAHDTGNEVTGINLETGAIEFTVPDVPRAEEVIPSRSGDVLWVSSRGSNSVKRINLLRPQDAPASANVGVQPESMMLTPDERTLVVSLRGTPASLGFVDTATVGTSTPEVHLVPIAGPGSAGDLAVMTANGQFVFASFDNGAAGTGGIVVVDVRTRKIVNSWDYPGPGRPHGIWYSRKAARF